MCIYTHRQALISGIEEAWEFFGGITRRLILDNIKAAVVKSAAMMIAVDRHRKCIPKSQRYYEKNVQKAKNITRQYEL